MPARPESVAKGFHGEATDVTVLFEGLHSIADFLLNEQGSVILLPDLLAGTLTGIER